MSRWYRNLTHLALLVHDLWTSYRGIRRPPETNRDRYLRQQRRKHQR